MIRRQKQHRNEFVDKPHSYIANECFNVQVLKFKFLFQPNYVPHWKNRYFMAHSFLYYKVPILFFVFVLLGKG